MSRKQQVIQLRIDDACQQPWNEMLLHHQGRFCHSCEKTVVDFSDMTDEAILQFLQKHQGEVCARLRIDQMHRDLVVPQAKKGWKKWKAIALLVIGLLSNNDAHTQVLNPKLPLVRTLDLSEHNVGFEYNFLGNLKDEEGNFLSDATVRLLINGALRATTVSHQDGTFQFAIPYATDFKIEVRHVAYKKKVTAFEGYQHGIQIAEIQLQAGLQLQEVLVTEYQLGLLYRDGDSAKFRPNTIASTKDLLQTVKAKIQEDLRGIVTDDQGTPLAHANIQLFVNGQYHSGTSSNGVGAFQLRLPPTTTECELEVSYVGYQTEVVPLDMVRAKLPILQVVLQSGLDMEEVLVVASALKREQSFVGMIAVNSQVCWQATAQGQKTAANPKTEQLRPSISEWKVFPNPFTDQLQIDLQVEKEEYYLFQLYSKNGQLLLAETKILSTGRHEVQLPVKQEWPAAAYVLVISDQNQNVLTKQLIKVNQKGRTIQQSALDW